MNQDWNAIIQEAIALRHQLHRHPELTWREQRTAAYLQQQLDALNIDWRSCADYGIVATLAKDAPGEHIALRADMDALPIQEESELPFRSQVDGCMHACGHDGHCAALWAAAKWLKQNERSLPGPVTLLFQPAEEGGHGARRMIEDGALDGIDMIFGWHNWPAIPFGHAICPDGAVMSGNGTFTITLHGEGGHASQPELCRDPVLAAAAVTMNLQQIVSRRLPPQAASVVSVTAMNATSAQTVIPPRAELSGSIRLASPHLRQEINQHIRQISEDTARSYGVTATIDIEDRYDPTMNHQESASRYRHALCAEFGEDWSWPDQAVPIMASEDFHYYLNEIPGAFALIGMSENEQYQTTCHSPHYQFNDRIIERVTRLFARLVNAPLP